jgi:hypothetical protein
MSAPACAREHDVLDLVAIGQWPARADEALRAHAAECAICRDLAAVAGAISAFEETSRQEIRVPDASVVWYRAQLRAREDSARRAARPLVIVPLLGALALVLVVLLALRSGGAWLMRVWSGVAMPSGWTDLARGMFSVDGPHTAARWLGIGMVGWMVLIPLAFYIATLADRTSTPRTHRRG